MQLDLIRRQNNRAGQKWHVKLDEGVPAVCPDAAELQAERQPDTNWQARQRTTAVEWDSNDPTAFNVTATPGARIAARDICPACATGLLKRIFTTEGKGAHAEG